MKAVFIALMLGSMGGFIYLLIYGFDSFYKCHILAAYIFWSFSGLLVVITVISFIFACKFGRAEDRKSEAVDGKF